MATTSAADQDDLTAAGIAWDIDPLLDEQTVDQLLDQLEVLAGEIEAFRGRVAELDPAELASLMQRFGDFQDVIGRVGSYAGLKLAENMLEESNGALMAKVNERATTIATKLVFFE